MGSMKMMFPSMIQKWDHGVRSGCPIVLIIWVMLIVGSNILAIIRSSFQEGYKTTMKMSSWSILLGSMIFSITLSSILHSISSYPLILQLIAKYLSIITRLCLQLKCSRIKCCMDHSSTFWLLLSSVITNGLLNLWINQTRKSITIVNGF